MSTRLEKTIMKPLSQLLLLGAVAFSLSATAQNFTSGSTGADGPLVVNANTNIVLPASGVLNYTTVNIAANRTVTFTRNDANTPVHILATGNVTIAGDINVSGSSGNNVKGGESGPGGFNGGSPGSVSTPAGAGYGPGAGRGGINSNNTPDGAGSGAFSTVGTTGSSTRKGAIYGNALLIPMIGGSGGGGTEGTPGNGGAGGAGAILISSTTRIDLTGQIVADGGQHTSTAVNGGSGGAVRLVAPVVAGTGRIYARGNNGNGNPGMGRIRIDATDRSQMNFQFFNPDITSVGSLLLIFPTPLPRLDIIEAAGTAIPVNSGPVTLQLPFGSSPNRSVRIQARDFNAQVPITLVLTPDHGAPLTYTGTINNTGANNPNFVDINVVMPINEQTTFHVYSK